MPDTPRPPDESGPNPRRGWADDHRTLVLATLGAVALIAVVAALALRAGGSGGDHAGAVTGGGVGAAMGAAIEDASTVPSNQSPPVSDVATTTTGPIAHPDLPPVTIPTHSAPPTTLPNAKPSAVPGPDGDMPLWGHLLVDLKPGGYVDFAVHLRKDQDIQVLSLADDGIDTDIEMFAPDGTSVGSWKGGQPKVVNGLEFSPDSPLPATGTYVIRVVHTGGSDNPFLIGFFGER